MGVCRLIGAVGLMIALQIAVAQAADSAQPVPPFVVPLAADGVQRVTITLDSYSYTPNHVIVEAGKLVELTLTSVTTITPHNFIIKELPSSRTCRREDDHHQVHADTNGNVSHLL